MENIQFFSVFHYCVCVCAGMMYIPFIVLKASPQTIVNWQDPVC